MSTTVKKASEVTVGERIPVFDHYETVVSISSDINSVNFLVQGAPGETLIRISKTPNTRIFVQPAEVTQ